MHFDAPLVGGCATYDTQAPTRARHAAPDHEMRSRVRVFFLPRSLFAMSYQTTIKQPDGDITAIDVSTTLISDEQSQTIAQAVEMLMDGAEREAADALRKLASSIDGRNPEADVERLRDVIKTASSQLDEVRRAGTRKLRCRVNEVTDNLVGAFDAAEDGGDE